MGKELKAPFPYFGGKAKVASLIWERFGDVNNYIEPFAGSLAVLLRRPTPPRVETVNELDCYVSNFWRATSANPERVAQQADWPVSEVDLHSRHRWLVLSDEAVEFRRRMREYPDYYDAKLAGWWCWGLCCWIGSGWCAVPGETAGEIGCEQHRRPIISQPGSSAGNGVHGLPAKIPMLSGDSKHSAGACGHGVHGNDAAGTCAQRRAWLLGWFGRLRDRLRSVRVCCGDWSRVCNSESVTVRLGVTGVFLDPPYGASAGRDAGLYATDSLSVANEARRWCLEWGAHPSMRIALCGYAGEGHETLEAEGWQCVAWKASGGYGNRSEKGKANAAKERIWFSPHCNAQRSLFDIPPAETERRIDS